MVGVNPWVVHRNKEVLSGALRAMFLLIALQVYGEDVETFRPERWLAKEDAGDMRRTRVAERSWI